MIIKTAAQMKEERDRTPQISNTTATVAKNKITRTNVKGKGERGAKVKVKTNTNTKKRVYGTKRKTRSTTLAEGKGYGAFVADDAMDDREFGFLDF